MSLHDQMAADAAKLFFNPDEFGEDVTYTPDSGGDQVITVVFTFGDDYGKGFGPIVSGQGVMSVTASDFPGEKPKGTITRSDGSVWTIGQEISSDVMTRDVEIKSRPRAAFGVKNGTFR